MRETTKLAVNANHFIAAGMLASISASVCCIGPFALLATGINAAWISRLMVVEPFQPLLIAMTLVLFTIAAWKLFSSATAAENCSSCQTVRVAWPQKLFFASMAGVASILLTSEYWLPILAG